MRTYFNRKYIFIIVLAVLVAVLIGCASRVGDFIEKKQLKPDLELENALVNMSVLENYRYEINAAFEYETRKEVISQLKGEKEQGKTHIKGEMVKSAVDIYFIDGMIYNYDVNAKKWMIIDSGSSNSEDMLISELNPLSNLRFLETGNPEKLRFEQMDGCECLVVRCHPILDNQALENLWKDFEYLIWIDYKRDLIRGFSFTALNKANDKTQLYLQVAITDFDQSIGINAPEV